MNTCRALRRWNSNSSMVTADDLAKLQAQIKFKLHKVSNTRLTLFEGDIDRMAEVLTKHSTINFLEFRDNKKKITASAQFLDPDTGLVENDFTVVKPLEIRNKKIRPKENQLIVETSVGQANDVCSAIKHFARRKHRLSLFNLAGGVFSYRLFNLTSSLPSNVEMRGMLNKDFYPPREERIDTDPDQFLDICAFHPKTHVLWYSIYSANPRLHEEIPDVIPAAPWEYLALRAYNRLPELDDCTDFPLASTTPSFDNFPFNKDDYPGKNVDKDGRKGVFTIAYADTKNWEAYGDCLGIAESEVKDGIHVKAGTHIEDKNGSRMLTVIASIKNVCLVFLDEACHERLFKLENDIFLHVFQKAK